MNSSGPPETVMGHGANPGAGCLPDADPAQNSTGLLATIVIYYQLVIIYFSEHQAPDTTSGAWSSTILREDQNL
jgi:hypothetical protein